MMPAPSPVDFVVAVLGAAGISIAAQIGPHVAIGVGALVGASLRESSRDDMASMWQAARRMAADFGLGAICAAAGANALEEVTSIGWRYSAAGVAALVAYWSIDGVRAAGDWLRTLLPARRGTD